MSKVSCVVATYNGEKFLLNQLNSLLTQSRPADEVIICDDASVDGTEKIVCEFLEKHQLKNWCFLPHSDNVGFVKNFYRAIKEAKGDIIFLCDQDDEWEKEKIEKMCAFFDSYDDALSLCTALFPTDSEGNGIHVSARKGFVNCGLVKGDLVRGECKKISLSEALKCNPSAGCTMAFRRYVADEFIKHSGHIMPHDHELNLIAAKNGGLYFLNEQFTRYRLHGNNTLGFNHKKQTRAEIAREKHTFSLALANYGVDYTKTLDKRAQMLENKSFLKLLFSPFSGAYTKIFGFRVWLGDILYCLKGR